MRNLSDLEVSSSDLGRVTGGETRQDILNSPVCNPPRDPSYRHKMGACEDKLLAFDKNQRNQQRIAQPWYKRGLLNKWTDWDLEK